MINLYRNILRTHRRLPPAMRALGDNYVKAEFKRHQNADEKYTAIFEDQWRSYAQTLSNQVSNKPPLYKSTKISIESQEALLDKILNQEAFGAKLSPTDLEQFSDEHVGQLWQLSKRLKEK